MNGADSQGSTNGPGFVRADRIPRTNEPTSSIAGAAAEAMHRGETDLAVPLGASVVAPELSLAQAKNLWTQFLDLRDVILADPQCVDEIQGHLEMNRTGATRLATAFGLSVEHRSIEEGRVHQADDSTWDYRFRVVVRVSKGHRYVDGLGSCRLSEIAEKTKKGEPVPYSQREHFALTKAATRATKRAIADILGGTEA